MSGDHMLIGFRIEFRARASGELIGAVYCEDAFLAAALPRAGDLVTSRITGGISLPGWLPGAFMTVAAVEHYPAKPPDQPGVQVVIRLETDRVPAGGLQSLEAYGWTVDLSPQLFE